MISRPQGQPAPASPPGAGAEVAAGQVPGLTIDAIGRKCPIPIIMLAERIREVAVGRLVEVLADDPAARTDLPAWCQIKSHECAAVCDRPAGWAFWVRRCY